MPPQSKKDEQETPVGPVKGQENPEVNTLLSIAQDLRDQKDEVFASIGANRDILRNYAKMGYLSDEQAEAIAEFYPPHQKKDKAEAESATPAAA